MALDVTIAPTAGQPVLLVDGSFGADPGFSALDWRRFLQAGGAVREAS